MHHFIEEPSVRMRMRMCTRMRMRMRLSVCTAHSIIIYFHICMSCCIHAYVCKENVSVCERKRKLITVYDCEFSKIISLKPPSILLKLWISACCLHEVCGIEWHTRICSSAITIETINWNKTFRCSVIKLTFPFWFMFKRWKDLRRYLLDSTYRLFVSSSLRFFSLFFFYFLLYVSYLPIHWILHTLLLTMR